MGNKGTIPAGWMEAAKEAGRAGAREERRLSLRDADLDNAVIRLLKNYRRIERIIADEEAYCKVDYQQGRKSLSSAPQPTGFVRYQSEAEKIEELQEEKRMQFKRTKRGFDRLRQAINACSDQREFVVIRLYYLGEKLDGSPREDKSPTWEEVVFELQQAGLCTTSNTARKWADKIISDIAICLFGIEAAVSQTTKTLRKD